AGANGAPAAKVYDALVIGGGHNGLICAWTLARAGRSVVLLEASATVGGAAVTREFAPGFRVSAGAHLVHLMPADLLRDLDLGSHGLEWAARNMTTTALAAPGSPVVLDGGTASGVSAADAQAYQDHAQRMRRFAGALVPMFSRAPPRLGTEAWSDRLGLLRIGWQIRRLGRRDMRELLRIGGMNVYDLLEERFESDALKGALGLDAVLGTNFGPRSPGTVLTLFHRLAGEHAAGPHGLCQPRGGLGALAAALAKAAARAGVEIRCQAPVASILVEDDRAAGAALESGETVRARTVISSADPKTTFLGLLGARHLDASFVRRVNHIRSRGLAAKLHLALAQAPSFSGVPASALGGRLLVAPSLDYIERAYNHSKYREHSAQPAIEITLPSVNDAALAPPGRHVMSAILQYVPHTLAGGWEHGRERCIDAALDVLEAQAPGLKQSVIAAELLTPLDLEREFRMSGGHWHHGDLAFDQFLMVRPVPGAAQYRAPIAGLYLCGAGCHPGGGVMGVAGRNAALEVLKA
ncbi:MAG TPA: NAD(P)/FAD-dependent oxidoreductase, partial [Steroidobacteraceae bacterium]|nr:NAD(P)/FAD-dependent oxidoreductase [Steroidobacteraceae bacterium]